MRIAGDGTVFAVELTRPLVMRGLPLAVSAIDRDSYAVTRGFKDDCAVLRRDCASFSGGLAMAGFLQASCFHYAIVLRRIYTIALYCYYPSMLYHSYLIVSRQGLVRTWSRPVGSAAPHPAANS